MIATCECRRRNMQWRDDSTASTSDQVSNANQLYGDLCQAMVKIPWRCLNDTTWNNFLKKYTGQTISNKCTLRSEKLSAKSLWIVYSECPKGCRNIWIFINEQTVTGRCIANLVGSVNASFARSCAIRENKSRCHRSIRWFGDSNVTIIKRRRWEGFAPSDRYSSVYAKGWQNISK